MRRQAIIVVVLLLGLAGRVLADDNTKWYSTKTKTLIYSAALTDSVLWTPASGYRVILQGCVFSATNAGTVRIRIKGTGTDVVPLEMLNSYGAILVGGADAPVWVGTEDQALSVTSTITGGTASILCWGYEDLF